MNRLCCPPDRYLPVYSSASRFCVCLFFLFISISFTTLAGSAASNAGSAKPCSGKLLDVQHLIYVAHSSTFHDDNGGKYFLAGLSIAGFPDSADSARTFRNKSITTSITAFTANKAILAYAPQRKPDRYNRRAIYLYSTGKRGQLLQQILVENGLALVHPGKAYSKQPECLTRLLQLERQAEQQQRGIWGGNRQLVVPSDDHNWLAKVDAYRIVEGKVLSVGETGSRFYLNFGRDWQNDFTVTVAKRVAKRLLESTGNLKELTGKNIRVRGWMISSRGPKIEVYYPGQIKILDN